MKVPQFIPYIGKEEYLAIQDCFDQNWITEGPKSKEFNNRLCEMMKVKYGVFAPNGTLALYMGLKALGIGTGDEVIVPDMTFIASANAVEMTGATPVFVDVDRGNYQIDVQKCSNVLTNKTKAIMPVHLYGASANMDAVMEFSKQHNLKVIEDAAQALGVYWNNKHCGTFGDIGCFSFFADKTITTGEGGFVVTNNEELYHRLLYLRNQGRIDRGTFIHPEVGYNFRITDIQAAMGIAQLKKFGEIKRKKLHVLQMYNDLLSNIGEIAFFKKLDKSSIIPFRVCIICDDAHDLIKYMSTNDIECRTFFYPLHLQPAYGIITEIDLAEGEKLVYINNNSFPNAINGYEHGVCLPSFPDIKDEQVEYVCEVIKEFYHV